MSTQSRLCRAIFCLLFAGVGAPSGAAAAPPDPEAVRSLVATLRAADESEPTFVAEWDSPRCDVVLTIGYSARTGAYFKATGKKNLGLRTPDGREFGRMAREDALKPWPHEPRTEPSIYAIPLSVPQALRRAVWRAPEAIEAVERLDGGGFRVESSIVGEVLAPAPLAPPVPGSPSAPREHLTVWFDKNARVVKWTISGYAEPVEPTFLEIGGVRLPSNDALGGWRLRAARQVTTPDDRFFDPDAVVKLVEAVAPARAQLAPAGPAHTQQNRGPSAPTRSTRSWAAGVAGLLVVLVGAIAWVRRRA